MKLEDFLIPHTIANLQSKANSLLMYSQNIEEIIRQNPQAILVHIGDNERVLRNLNTLSPTPKKACFIDVGQCKRGKTKKESKFIISETLKILSQFHVPIIINNIDNIDITNYVEETIQHISYPTIVSIEETIAGKNAKQLHKISCTYEHTKLINIAYQEYLTMTEDVQYFKHNYNIAKRLGVVRKNIQNTEPYLRDAAITHCHTSAIRHSDFPANKNPNGLYAEEICQLVWFAGYSNSLKLLNIISQKTANKTSVELLSHIIWHALDGISQKPEEKLLFDEQNLRKKFIKSDIFEQDILFVENFITKQTWIEIPTDKKQETRKLPVSHADYQIFTKGEIANNWINEVLRINRKRKK